MISSASRSATNALGLTNRRQPLDDRGRANPREIEPLAPRMDRDRDLFRLRRAKYELHVLRRLLQRLQKRVERLPRQHVDFVDDVNLVPRAAGTHGDVLAKLANFIDAAVARPVDLDHVHVAPLADGEANVALVARRRRRPLDAIQALRQNPGGRSLADPARATEQISVPHAVGRNRPGHRPRDVLLPDQLLEGLRAVAARDDDIRAVVGGLGFRFGHVTLRQRESRNFTATGELSNSETAPCSPDHGLASRTFPCPARG